MDGTVFERLTRFLTFGTRSRRAILEFLAGGATLTRLGLAEATAGCGRVGRPCERSGECCRGAVCKGGACRCNKRRHFADCDGDGRCENLRTDNGHCGTCGFACPPGSTCRRGACTCPDGRTVCFFSGNQGECCAAGEECTVNGAGEGFCDPV